MKKPSKKSRRKTKTQQEDEAGGGGDFAFKISKVAVSQICRSVGLRGSQGSALGALTLVATKYMEALGRWAVSFSNAAGRTQSNLLDLTNALHDLSLLQGQGFTGASTLYQDHSNSCCLLKSSVLEALSGFVTSTLEMPFAKPIHRARAAPAAAAAQTTQQVVVVVNNNNKASSSSPSTTASTSRGGHVPEWLPGFPPDHVGSTSNDKKRVSGEELWESCGSSSVLGCPSNGVEEEEIIRSQLANKRTTRVKFRINNGGGGRGGKRLHLNNNKFTPTKTIDDEKEEAQAESKEEAPILVYKRRRR